MTRPVRLIATDLDGTFVHSDGTVHEANLIALQAARQAGIHVVVSTGRRHSYAMRVLRTGVLLPHEYIVSSNGAVIRTFAGDLFWRETLSTALVRRLCRVLDRFRNALVLTFDNSGPDGTDAPGALAVQELDTLHGSIRRWMETNASSLQCFPQIEDALQDNGPAPIQAMVCGAITRTREAERLLQEHFATEVETFRTEYPSSDLCILDIVPRGVSKGAALRRLTEFLGLGMNEVAAVGDNWNDLPMLAAVGHPTLLQNAPADLLTLAQLRGWRIGCPGDADGFAEAVGVALSSQDADA